MEIALAVLLVLAFPIIAIAGLVIAIGARDRVRTLEQRFADFQRVRPSDSTAAAAAPRPQAPVTPAPQPPRPIRAAPGRDPRRARLRQPRAAAAASVPPSAASATPSVRAGRAGHGLRGTPRHPMDRLGRRRRARVRRFLPGALFDRAGLVRPRHARLPRRTARACADRRRRMGAPQGELSRASAAFRSAHIPSILTAAGTAVAYADIWAAFALYQFIDAPASPSSCSASSHWRRSPPRWCTARRSPGSAWSAPT